MEPEDLQQSLSSNLSVSASVTIQGHDYALHRASLQPDPMTMDRMELVARITNLNRGLQQFWGSAHGWAPLEAAELLSRSRLDWQVSLSASLQVFLNPLIPEAEQGLLILAWTNLGSLLEGSMKLFLSVWYKTYTKDAEAIVKKDKLASPDDLWLEALRQFFCKRIWGETYNKWALHIQHRRNAVHAFKDKEIGSFDEFWSDAGKYLGVLRYINFRLPYPDEVYEPREK